jgi:hypothetical protein
VRYHIEENLGTGQVTVRSSSIYFLLHQLWEIHVTYIQRGLILALCAGSLAACSGMSRRDQRTLSGGAIGAGAGGVAAAIVGAPLLAGAAIGAAGGAVIGNVTTPTR